MSENSNILPTIFYSNSFGENHRVNFIEWEGTCVQGTCFECNSPPIPALPFLYCNDGRSCKEGFEVYAPLGILSLNYVSDTPNSAGTLIQMTLIFLTLFTMLVGFLGVVYYKNFNQTDYQNRVTVGYSPLLSSHDCDDDEID